jgi:hypothetical protein
MPKYINADKLMGIYSDKLEEVIDRYGMNSSAAGVLAGAMKLLEEQHDIWNSCWDRLPESIEKSYLVQLDTGYICECRWTDSNPFWTSIKTRWHWNIFDIPQFTNVVAWMEKPDLYIEKEES